KGRRRLAADAVVHVRHETGDALVMNGDRLDVVGAFVERVEEADIAVAAQAENVRHLFAHQIVDDHLTAVEHVLGHRLTASGYWGWTTGVPLMAVRIARQRRLELARAADDTNARDELFGRLGSGLLALRLVALRLGTAVGHAKHRLRRRQPPKRRLASLIFE